MTRDEPDEALAKLLDARAESAPGTPPPEVSDEDRAEIESLLNVADLLWESAHGAPPLDSDPVAAMLGLVPDSRQVLDPKALARARKAAHLKPSQLAERLAARGWDVQTRDVFRWENQSTADVAPALIEAIAEETGTNMDRLTTNPGMTAEQATIAAATQSPRFAGLVERWARIQRVPSTLAASALESRMLATVHRGDRPDTDQLLQSLDALVTALEREG